MNSPRSPPTLDRKSIQVMVSWLLNWMMVGVLKKKLTTAGKINRRSKALFQAPESLF